MKLGPVAPALAAALALSACAAPEGAYVDPLTVVAPDSPNWALAAPEGVATASAPSLTSLVLEASPEQALALLDAVALAEPRVRRVAREGEPALGATYVQRSLVFRFPDVISVRALDLGDGGSSLAVYSASVYGYGDFGVNRERVERWLKAVAAQ